jgi:hypothetical protein
MGTWELRLSELAFRGDLFYIKGLLIFVDVHLEIPNIVLWNCASM